MILRKKVKQLTTAQKVEKALAVFQTAREALSDAVGESLSEVATQENRVAYYKLQLSTAQKALEDHSKLHAKFEALLGD